jgi:uncharacterized membrane protein YkvA (DUF1232 family)
VDNLSGYRALPFAGMAFNRNERHSMGVDMKAPWNLLRYLPMARRLIAAGRLPGLLFAVARKGSAEGSRLGRIKDDLRLLQALCLAYWRGEYRSISPKAILSIVAGLMYFLSPLDAVPDWIPGIGMLDDIAVLAWVMKSLDAELTAFRQWRERQSPEKLIVVERLPATAALLEQEKAKD